MDCTRRFFSCMAVMILLSATGCVTRHILSEPYPVDSLLIPDITSSEPVALVNNQDVADEVVVLETMGGKFVGNMQQYTDTVIETVQKELEKKNIQVSKDAKKVLKISVTKVEFFVETFNLRCDAFMEVETGDGRKVLIDGHDTTQWESAAINGALNHAAVTMLNDDTIMDYLSH